jgi:Ca-activated chloride channel homolog
MRGLRRRSARAAVGLLLLALLAGCSGDPASPGSGVTLRILGGSELADLAPILDQAAEATGVRVELDQTGTLEGAEQVVAGTDHDAIWFSSNRYLALQPGAPEKLGAATQIMSSPVVLGLRKSVADRLGWTGRPVTWAEIAAAAGQKQFTYAMTDPSASNSGFSTVVAVSTALAGTGAALTSEQAASTAPALRDFFSAQTLSAGSSGWLQEEFVRRGPAAPDGLMNYESVLLEMNAAGTLPEPLELIRPADGVVTAEYPLTVLNGAAPEVRDAVRALTDYLRTPDVQRQIMEQTGRRPAVPGVPLEPRFGGGTLVELPFPSSAAVVDTLLTSWFDKVRKPSRTIYVLDTSGSMSEDGRIDDLRQSLVDLAGADPSTTGRYSRFRGREEVTLLPFASQPAPPTTVTVPEDDPGPGLQQIQTVARGLSASGGTAIYDSLEAAYALAAPNPDYFTSIVLMTDGANTTGLDYDGFAARPRPVPVFTIVFGDGDAQEMADVARITGARSFDARELPLAEVFQEIRGYV